MNICLTTDMDFCSKALRALSAPNFKIRLKLILVAVLSSPTRMPEKANPHGRRKAPPRLAFGL